MPPRARCVVIHEVYCDGCHEEKIRGTRYKCDDCPFYDLCSKCYIDGKHDKTHRFVKIGRVGQRPEVLDPRSKWQKKQTASSEREFAESGPFFLRDETSVRDMKMYLAQRGVSAVGTTEKEELKRLVWHTFIRRLEDEELNEVLTRMGIEVEDGGGIEGKRQRALEHFPKLVKSSKPAAAFHPSVLEVGQRVELCGLKKAEMNGRAAKVLRDELVSGRVEVELLDGSKMCCRVKPENVAFASSVLD